MCRQLGWLVNLEKPELEPKQVFDPVEPSRENFETAIASGLSSLEAVAGRRQRSSWSTITPNKACPADLYRCIKTKGGALT